MTLLVDNFHRCSYCPLCGSTDLSIIGRTSTPMQTSYSTHEIQLSRQPELWRCRSCGSRFTQNAVPPAEAKRLYSTGVSGERWSTERWDATKCSEVVDTLRQILRPGNSVLDIGCSTGQFLDFAKERGCRTAGVEYSVMCGPVLQERGHRWFRELNEVDGEQFDILTAFDLIEHLYDVPAFLRRCRDALSPGGELLVLTGNASSLSARLAGSAWWYVRYPEHIVFPSTRFLANALPGFGIERRLATFAASGYRNPWPVVVRRSLPAMLSGRYDGLPAIGPDHVLMGLRNA